MRTSYFSTIEQQILRLQEISEIGKIEWGKSASEYRSRVHAQVRDLPKDWIESICRLQNSKGEFSGNLKLNCLNALTKHLVQKLLESTLALEGLDYELSRITHPVELDLPEPIFGVRIGPLSISPLNKPEVLDQLLLDRASYPDKDLKTPSIPKKPTKLLLDSISFGESSLLLILGIGDASHLVCIDTESEELLEIKTKLLATLRQNCRFKLVKFDLYIEIDQRRLMGTYQTKSNSEKFSVISQHLEKLFGVADHRGEGEQESDKDRRTSKFRMISAFSDIDLAIDTGSGPRSNPESLGGRGLDRSVGAPEPSLGCTEEAIHEEVINETVLDTLSLKLGELTLSVEQVLQLSKGEQILIELTEEYYPTIALSGSAVIVGKFERGSSLTLKVMNNSLIEEVRGIA